MVFRIRRILLEGFVYLLTVSCAAGLLAGMILAAPAPDSSPAGWAHLSLPASMVIREDPMAGWCVFRRAIVKVEMPDESPGMSVPAGHDFEIPLEKEAPRFEIVGVLNAPDDKMYCFFDTNTRRWFWLAGGGEIPELEVSLSIVDGQPKLMRAGSELDFTMRAD
jgi:hypothetical protein